MQDNRLIDVPMVIETPKEKELLEDIDNIKLLRSLALHLD
jgi:endonuclease IV